MVSQPARPAEVSIAPPPTIMCSVLAMTPSPAETLRRPDTCLPFLRVLLDSPNRPSSAPVWVQAQVEAVLRLRRPPATPPPPAATRDPRTTELVSGLVYAGRANL